MAGRSRWYFDREALANSPSRKFGVDADKELSYRQQAANMIQDMGQRLQVTQLCINTAIVYMHRFYVFHSFTKYHRSNIAACALFLAAKVEEQPRKLEHVIRVAHLIQHQKSSQLDLPAEAAKLVKNENVMLQTLGFDIAIEHPHTFVVKCCQLVRASKDLAQTCYFMATNSLHLTTMCLQYRPTVVACVCIHLACKWSNWEIPLSAENKQWWLYVDTDVTLKQLEEVTTEFLAILDKCPSRLKRKIMSGGGQGSGCDTLLPNPSNDLNLINSSQQSADSRLDLEPLNAATTSRVASSNSQSSSSSLPAVASTSSRIDSKQPAVPSITVTSEDTSKFSPLRSQTPAVKEKQSFSAYKEKREQERKEQERKEIERHELEKKRAEEERIQNEIRAEAQRRVAAEQQQKQERLEREKRELEAQRKELEKREAERRDAERLAEQERAERRERDRRAELERLDAIKREAERRDEEKKEQERLKAERDRLVELERQNREAERKEAERKEQQRAEEDRRRREEQERQQEAAARVYADEQVKREADKKNRFFTSRTPATPLPPFEQQTSSFETPVMNSRIKEEPNVEDKERHGSLKRESTLGEETLHQKHHKSEKSHKKNKKNKKDRHKDKKRDRHEKVDSTETLPPLKIKIKPMPAEPPDLPEPCDSLKIRIPRDLIDHSSSTVTTVPDPESTRKRKNSFEATGSISKKPVV